MNVREFTRTPALQAASTLLVIAALVLVWTMARALRADAIPAPTPASSTSAIPAKRGPARAPANIEAAVENDLFSPDRTAPDTPYRMPGESSPDDKPRAEPMKPVVLGTAVADDGRNFATLQLGSESPRLVHAGDRIGEWIVRSIARGKVVLETNDGARAELVVPKPGI
jgi:hypothetical protein